MGEEYGVIVIGGGPAGYVGAIRAAQLGIKTAIVEKEKTLGGTCLNVGCIPSKALLQSSHHFEMAKLDFSGHGISFSNLKLDLKSMMDRKNKVVEDLTKGIDFLIKKNKIDHFNGHGTFISESELNIAVSGDNSGTVNLKGKNFLIASGSSVKPLPAVEIDEERIVSSTGALSLKKVPKTMTVVGAGVIGLELGSVWKRLGAEVTVVEFLDSLLPGMDKEISTAMKKILQKQGLNFRMETKVTGAKVSKSGVELSTENVNTNETEMVKSDIVLVAIGRQANVNGFGLKKIGVDIDDSGFVIVDKKFQTSVSGIYAVGDVIGGAMLAHKAEEEASVCAEIIAGQTGHLNYDAVPNIVYTHPEVASVGKTVEQLTKEGVQFKVGKFPFSANSRARCNADTDGFVKIIAEKKSDLILGCHIIGAGAGDLIQEIIVAMELSASSEDIARICHGHPGLPEALKEAALALGSRAIHL